MTKTWLKLTPLSQRFDSILHTRPSQLQVLLKVNRGSFSGSKEMTKRVVELLRLSDAFYASDHGSYSDIQAAAKVTRCVKQLHNTSFAFSGLEKMGITDVVVKKSAHTRYLVSQQLKVLKGHPTIDVGLRTDVLQIDPSLAEAIFALGVKYLVLPSTATEKEIIAFDGQIDSIKPSVPIVLELPSISSASYGGHQRGSVAKELSEKVRRISEKSHNTVACIVSVEEEELKEDTTISLLQDVILKIRNMSLK